MQTGQVDVAVQTHGSITSRGIQIGRASIQSTAWGGMSVLGIRN